MAVLIADAKRLFTPVDAMEITLEANPTSVEAERFAAFRNAGVNRVSIGVQSLDGEALRMLDGNIRRQRRLSRWRRRGRSSPEFRST